MKSVLITATLALTASISHAALTWVGTTGGGNGTSLFQEANWIDTGTGAAPPAGAVDGNVALAIYPGGVIMDGTGLTATNTYGPYSPNFDLGTNTLTLSSGILTGNGIGLRTNDIGGNQPQSLVTVSSNAQVDMLFILDIDLVLSDAAVAVFRGGGNPINLSTIDATSLAASILWTAETPTAVINEHLGKITFGGAPIVLGADPAIPEPGDNAILTSPGGPDALMTFVPEPATTLLGALGLLALLRRRR